MNNWFESKVKFDKTQENGLQKKVTEVYVFDALSWTEAEARTIEELTPFITGEFIIVDIKRVKLSEIFFNTEEKADKWFKGKITFILIDEKSGAEKRSSVYMLAQAKDIDQAQEVIKKGMEGSMSDYEIAEIKETPIMDVFPYSDDKKNSITP